MSTNTTSNISSIYARLARVQAKLRAPKSEKNQYAGFAYRTAEGIYDAARPLCEAEGLYLNLSEEVKVVGERYYLECTATVYDDAGNSVSTRTPVREAAEKKGLDPAQVSGTAISYARKYAMCGLFAIGAGEKDMDAYSPADNSAVRQDSLDTALKLLAAAKTGAQVRQIWDQFRATLGDNEAFREAVKNHRLNPKRKQNDESQ